MIQRAAVAVSCLILLAACQAPPPPEPEFTEADRQAIADEVLRLTQETYELGRPEDFETSMAYWAEGTDAFFVGEPAVFAQGVRVINSKEDMVRFFGGFVGTRTSTNFDPQASYAAVLSPDVAVTVTEQHWNITDTLGVTGSTFPLSSTTVWVKEDGAWKIMHHHQSWTNNAIEEEGEG